MFRNFYGDTIVFAIEDSVKEKLAEYVELLYQSASECFCERLVPHTFHVTLHDLSNAPVLRDVAEELFKSMNDYIDIINLGCSTEERESGSD